MSRSLRRFLSHAERERFEERTREYAEAFAALAEPLLLQDLLGEANWFRYQPSQLAVVLGDQATALDVASVSLALELTTARAQLFVLSCASLPAYAVWLLQSGHARLVDSPDAVAAHVAERALPRVRLLGVDERESIAALGVLDAHLIHDPVSEVGRVELLRYLVEQSVSINQHRYGNLGMAAASPGRGGSLRGEDRSWTDQWTEFPRAREAFRGNDKPMASTTAHARDAEPASGATTRTSALARSVTTTFDEVARLQQALLDLASSNASSVGLVQCASETQEAALGRELLRAARERSFVTARLSLNELSLDAPEELVSHLLDALTPPDETKPRGILRLLDRYFERHGKRSLERFDAAVEEHDALGDLSALCRAYLAAEDDAHREVKAFEAWASGTELKRRLVPEVRATLDTRTAQRALGDLTRIIRALGHDGLLLVLQGGGAITLRTARQREKSYTVLRELVDNFDAGHGVVATRIVISGDERLFEGTRGIRSLAPLLARLDVPGAAEPPPPHRSCTTLVADPYEFVHRRIRQPDPSKAAALRSLIRISQGLPPTEAVASMSVGHERIDRTIGQLFEHAEASGSVFQVLVGDYGSGKTHLMLHLAERALAAKHPVFWLNLERMNLDLGSPEKHLGRLLAQSVLPTRHRPSALDRATAWTRTPAKLRALLTALEEIAQGSSEEAVSARKALANAQASKEPERALEAFLSATDLAKKGAGASYRLDAYRRLLLWLELLRRLEGCKGPVILIDEAENLYTTGMSHALRRAAMRTLSFYCGGAVPEACVVLAMTPPALAEMRKEVASLLEELDDVASTLALEDSALFRRRLRRLTPEEVPEFSRPMRLELAERVRATHRSVRGPVVVDDWQGLVARVVRAGGPPRVLIRQLVDELESAWWAGG